jgi:2-deoxy-D-gluconate 3-dehydrogenase
MSILDRFKLDGKTALVTGCRRGIGKGFAVALAEAGADIVGVSASMPESGSEVENEVRATGRNFRGYACDFRDRTAVYEFIRKVKSEAGPIDILVNNAGSISRAPAAEHDDERWDSIIEINLNSAFILAREFGKEMLERRSGKIIFTASLLSFQGGITVPGYAASKGGVAQLTKALANEWAGKNVQVNAIAPGYIARAAELREGMNQAEDAVRLWNEVLGRAPNDPKALDSLSKLYEKTKSAQNLADVFAQKAQLATDAREKRGLLVKAAHAQEEAGQDEKAAESYRAALAIQVVSDALEPLERVLGRLGRHADQVEVLAQLADRAVGEAREGLLLKRAQLLG